MKPEKNGAQEKNDIPDITGTQGVKSENKLEMKIALIITEDEKSFNNSLWKTKKRRSHHIPIVKNKIQENITETKLDLNLYT